MSNKNFKWKSHPNPTQKGNLPGDLTKYLKDNSEIISVALLVTFLIMIVYILMNCVDPAESSVIHQKEIKLAKQAEMELEKEKRAHERYRKMMKKLDETQKDKHVFEKENKSLITNLRNNDENLNLQLSSYANDRGGYQFKGQPENWYVSFAEQARMLYR